MNWKCVTFVAGALTFTLPPSLDVFADDVPPKVGSEIPRLTFKDIRYLSRSLDDLPNKTAYVLVFTSVDCPLAQRYMPTLKELEQSFRDRGVQFIAVNASSADSIMQMAEHAMQFGIEFPVLKDFDARCAKLLGVTRTPESVVLDSQKRLRYRGRIDDQYRIGGTQSTTVRHDLKNAIEEVLGNRAVTTPETPVEGCLINQAKPQPPAAVVNYADHVAPLVRQHCVPCHRPGTSAPFALTTYQAVASRAEMIAEVVAERRMPPWYGSESHDQFVNRRALTPDQQTLIMHWAESGTPRGDESKLPPLELPPADEKWLIGTPDLTIQESKTHELPADGIIPYQYVILPYIFPKETWIRSAQILPDNPRVVHHCNMAFVTAVEGFKASNFITGIVPGGEPLTMEQGTAYRLPAGATLVLQVHFVTTGKPETCRITVGINYASGVVQRRLQHIRLDNSSFAIPPGAPAHPVGDTRTLDCDAVGVGLFSHMHVRGKDMTFIAHKPDGTSDTMLVIPNYSFDWQHAYRWEPNTKRLPKGTRIECLAHYDNSNFNPFNPDPTATVKEGPQTFHEMMNGFFFYTDADEQLDLKIGDGGQVVGDR